MKGVTIEFNLLSSTKHTFLKFDEQIRPMYKHNLWNKKLIACNNERFQKDSCVLCVSESKRTEIVVVY